MGCRAFTSTDVYTPSGAKSIISWMPSSVQLFRSTTILASPKSLRMTTKGTEKQEFTFDWMDLNKRLNNLNYYAGNTS